MIGRIEWAAAVRSAFVGLIGLVLIAGCATLPPPGADYPKTASSAFDQPETTNLGRNAAAQTSGHPGLSGFRLFPRGVDGLLLRTQLIRQADRALDIQYYIFVEDYTGKVLLAELLRAADRGVRVRLLIDDLNSYGKPDTRATLAALSKHEKIEVRLFNPFAYRGDVLLFHRFDELLNAPRINHRMHNKLMVADGAVAVVGGRNVADEYFGTGAVTVRFADFDVAAFGPVVPGGCLPSRGPEDQEGVLARKLYALLETLAAFEVPTTLLHFPRLAIDSAYLFGKLSSFLPGVGYDAFAKTFRQTSRPEKIHSFRAK